MSTAIEGLDEIIKEFLVESGEGLDLLDRDLVSLERDPTSRELLAEVFRAVHTIKGTSGVLGFPKLEKVAHVGENLLSRMRDGKLLLNPAITSGLLGMVDAVRQLLANIEADGNEGSGDYAEVVQRLEGLLENVPPAQSQPPAIPALAQPLYLSPPPEPTITAEVIEPASPVTEAKFSAPAVPKDFPSPTAAAESLRETAASGSNIRVDVGLLDKMMNLVGELVLARNQILQCSSSQTDAGFFNAAQRLNLIATELQEGVMKTRMQPIGNVWGRFPRLVRDLALQCGKQVTIEMEGSDTELDKTIIEAIKDPLTHILRNSLDHGIESPEERVRKGKAPAGQLHLRAYHEGGQVNIEINDDGAGINLERVKQRAVQRGVIGAQQAERMSDRELMNLIFLPGFSTAEKVSNVSGRGVGMDVVKTNIEKIGGAVDLQSAGGQGTTLKIKIPLTLAIVPALIVSSGGERFAIPQISLLELVRLEASQGNTAIEHIQGAPVHRLRGRLLPLVFLNRELCLEEGQQRAETVNNIVVLQADGHQFGLVVDEINDTEEIVVKPLGKQLKGLSCFAGATIMGDGQVALILDVLGIAQKASVVTELHDQSLAETAAAQAGSQASRESWLLFRSAEGRRLAVPLSAVARLEEFPQHCVEHSGPGEVVQYRGEIMPLLRISRLLHENASEADPLQLVVFASHGKSLGLVVDCIEDITDEAVEMRDDEKRGFMLGSAVIQQKVTDILDLHEVALHAAHTSAAVSPGGS
jgi:two-component system chemotaxis sensor kinase CheA